MLHNHTELNAPEALQLEQTQEPKDEPELDELDVGSKFTCLGHFDDITSINHTAQDKSPGFRDLRMLVRTSSH